MLHSSAVKNDKGVIARSFAYNEYMKDGFTAGMLRGTDSSGVFQVDCKGKPFVSKMPLPGVYFATDSGAEAIINDTDESPITVGHVRAATSGKISADNAHPFSTKARADGSYIIGVHNGSLDYWKFDPKAGDYEVDSEWAFNLIAEEGADAFESIEGAFSFVWWDSRNPTNILFARNDKRPMFLLRSADGKSILGASEAGMMSWLADRANLNVETDIYSTLPGKMYRVDTSKELLVVEDLGLFPEAWGSQRGRTNTAMTPAPLGNTVLKNNDTVNWDEAMKTLRDTPAPSTRTDLRLVDDSYNEWDFGGEFYLGEDEDKLNRERMNTLIGNAKKALAIGRERLAKGITTDMAIELVFEEEDDNVGGDAWMDTIYRAPESWFTNENTTDKERYAAQTDGSYGVMVTYQPVAFDDERDEVVGEILAPGNSKNTLAYIRNTDLTTYTEEMKDRMVQVIIVGCAGVINGEPEYIVSPLTEEGEIELRKLVA